MAEEPTNPAAAVPAAAEPVTVMHPTVPPLAAAVEPAAPTPEPVAPVEPAAPSEAAPADPAFKPHTDTPTLLEGAGKAPEKPGEAKPVDPAAPAVPPEPRTYEAFKFPEGIAADDKQIAAYTEIAAKHNLDQDTAQSLLDMHTTALKQFADNTLAEQHRIFAETRHGWQTQVRADEELGGSGFDTSIKAVARMRDLLVPADRREAFNNFLNVTGAGDHPEFLRLLHNAARLFDEPAPPPPAAKPTRAGGGPARGNFASTMYDHPTSQRAASRS